ncbi:MAG: hypothetical protein Athens101428_231 [Candidatus Berkelbacteria bacterium Athens1014_28]|uniref:Uncharacterized protein n=1 Tax=Candidatus Berkelbacteria bacterium Athens1014_28 TaxID=2017145 RepID=A0A554LNZ5_9BACT|nr:MAG: hypothetical protein Athens101428_231 [Candidatus Berkelbacteria bacterium Athens1014_28]
MKNIQETRYKILASLTRERSGQINSNIQITISEYLEFEIWGLNII